MYVHMHTYTIIYLSPSGGEPSTIGVLEREGALGTLEVPGMYSYKANT